MECTNKLKQLGLALQSYADANKSFFPAGCGKFAVQGTPWANTSCFVMLCPYMEETARYDKISDQIAGNPMSNGNEAYKKSPAFMICPSEANPEGDWRSNYCASAGDWPDTFPGGKVNVVMATSAGGYENYCYNPRAPFISGLKFVKMPALKDGTSNTAVFSERVIADGTNNIYSSVALSGISSSDAKNPDAGWTPNTCAGLRDATNKYAIREGVSRADTWSGCQWADGRVQFVGFNTILPPNSVSCADGTDYATAVMSASSGHSGGVNVCRADGSVVFVSDTIDCSTNNLNNTGQDRAPVASGESPYGVWGALGSINGRETKTL